MLRTTFLKQYLMCMDVYVLLIIVRKSFSYKLIPKSIIFGCISLLTVENKEGIKMTLEGKSLHPNDRASEFRLKMNRLFL